MNTAITEEHIKNYAVVVTDILETIEVQAAGKVRRPRKEIVELTNFMVDTCAILHCQISGGPQPKPDQIKAIKQRFSQLMEGPLRRASIQST